MRGGDATGYGIKLKGVSCVIIVRITGRGFANIMRWLNFGDT